MNLPTLSLYSLLCFVNIVLPVSAIVAGLIIRDLSAYTSALVIIAWIFLLDKSSRPTTKATGSEGLLYVVYSKVRSWCISQDYQAGYEHICVN